MTQEEFKKFIKGKTIAEIELDSINNDRGNELPQDCISITKMKFTDNTTIEFSYDSFVDGIFTYTRLHP